MPIALITGGAGQIGPELARRLLKDGWTVRILDNFSTGKREHLDGLGVEVTEADIVCDYLKLYDALADVGMVWHLAAQTDIKCSEQYNFNRDYQVNLNGLWLLLHAMDERNVRRIAFTSTSAVYGDGEYHAEDHVPWPVSMYGATKLCGEHLIQAMCERAGFQGYVFRLCGIVGGRSRTHGNMVMPDFVAKLRKNPAALDILGDGKQTKPILHVTECVDAMLYCVEPSSVALRGWPYNVWNVGAARAPGRFSDTINVKRIAELACEEMGLKNVDFFYSQDSTVGWPGDVHSFEMDLRNLTNWGWKAKMNCEQAMRQAIREHLKAIGFEQSGPSGSSSPVGVGR